MNCSAMPRVRSSRRGASGSAVSELWFVGAGLSDERGLSARALEVLRASTTVFAEEYTAVLAPGTVDRLSKTIGRPIRLLDRPSLEDGRVVLEALDRGPTALLTAGDPFAATTHVALRLACERAGHDWRYLPNASVLTAAASFVGFQHYRFGRTVSLPFPEPGFSPTSPLEMIERNRAMGLHTLVLLDLRPSEGRFLTPREAIDALEVDLGGRRVVPAGSPVVVVARVGTDHAQAWYGPLESLRPVEFGEPMYALIVPAPTLHFEEEAAVERFRLR
jgi:diphthine synthase